MIRILVLIMTALPAIISYQMLRNDKMFLNALEQNSGNKLFIKIFGAAFAVTTLVGLIVAFLNTKASAFAYIILVVFVAMAFSLSYSAKIKKKLNS